MAVHAGSWFGLPDYGITEKFGSLLKRPLTPQGGSNIIGPAPKAAGPTPAPNPSILGYNTQLNSTSNFGAGSGGTYNPGGSGAPLPSTSGQAPSGGAGGSPDQSYIDKIKSEFGNVRGGYQDNINSYDSDYNISKQGTDEAIARAKDTLTTQTADEQTRYGQNLRSLLQTDKELRDRRFGTFSALGTLDSSAFQQDTAKGDQYLQDNQQKLAGERDRVIQGKEKEYSAYEKDATSKLALFANEIVRAKAGLKQAVAETNMNEANSILSYIDQMKQKAQAVSDQRDAMKMNLAQLQAQGVDVIGNLGKINSMDFSTGFGSALKGTLQEGQNKYSVPTNSFGSGYINPKTGRPFTDEERMMLGITA